LYSPTDNEELNINDATAEIDYCDKVIKLKYETEPPHGDFIYSVKICGANQSDVNLPFWVYGRNIRFRNHYVVFDAVQKNTTDCFSLIVDLIAVKYLRSIDWYNNFELIDNAFYFSNSFSNKDLKIAFENIEMQDWVFFGK